jgi:hypothetical protein
MKTPLIQERVLYPAHRHLRAGVLRGSGLYTVLGRALWTSPWRGIRFAPPLRCAGGGVRHTIPQQGPRE